MAKELALFIELGALFHDFFASLMKVDLERDEILSSFTVPEKVDLVVLTSSCGLRISHF